MKIIFDNALGTISVENVNLTKHVIAGVTSDVNIVLLRREKYGAEGFEAIILTKN